MTSKRQPGLSIILELVWAIYHPGASLGCHPGVRMGCHLELAWDVILEAMCPWALFTLLCVSGYFYGPQHVTVNPVTLRAADSIWGVKLL